MQNRSQRQAIADRLFREKLEKYSTSLPRANMSRILGVLATDDALSTRPLTKTLSSLRKVALDARDERYTPKLEAKHVMDAAGSVNTGGEGRDLWDARAAVTTPEWLGANEMRALAAAEFRSRLMGR
jgi:hypothetical protein